MTPAVKSYKVLLDQFTTNRDKNLVIDLSEMFQSYGYRDLIHLRAESYMDKFFATENPTIDFEKYKFRPDSTVKGIDFYFYRQNITTLIPVSYDDNNPPVWYVDSPTYKMSSGFNVDDVPDSTLFLGSYFKFDFYQDPILQKTLFSVALPLDGTMLISNNVPIPRILFTGSTKTEVENIYWLRRPEQLPLTTFTGGTLDLYCMISFFNSKTGKVINFKRDCNCGNNNSMLPGSNSLLSTYTMRDKYLLYRLDYTNLTYKILHIDGQPFNSNIVKLYAL